MRKIGEIFFQERQNLGKDLNEVARELKIKLIYLQALEKSDYEKIPGGAPIVIGIVKKYARFLGLNVKRMTAIFRRDFVDERKDILPNYLKDFSTRRHFRWMPFLTSGSVAGIIMILIIAFYFCRSFLLNRPPSLELLTPQEHDIIKAAQVKVSGKVMRADVLLIDNETVSFEDGHFVRIINCYNGENTLLVEAINPQGKKTQTSRHFICQF